jgi:hypothetical protein
MAGWGEGGGTEHSAGVQTAFSARFPSVFYSEPVFVNLLNEPRNRFSAWWRAGTVRQPYLTYWPARLHRLATSIPGLLIRLQIRALEEVLYIVHMQYLYYAFFGGGRVVSIGNVVFSSSLI